MTASADTPPCDTDVPVVTIRNIRSRIAGADAPESDWRADVRLFATTWTMGFLFVLVIIA